MKISIEYESSWRNSFLAGSNNEALPNHGRKFIGSMTELKKLKKNFIKREVTIDTVMGILNRIIGDQKKLYQSRNSSNYYFKNIEPSVKFIDKKYETNEMTYIRNITGNTDQNSFTGAIKTNDDIFLSDYSAEFWGVLALNFVELCQFIISSEKKVTKTIQTDPISIDTKLKSLSKEKPVANEGLANEALKKLNKKFANIEYLNKKGYILPGSFYCSSLYLQLERLSNRFDISPAKADKGVISGTSTPTEGSKRLISDKGVIRGISKRTFTSKDFMERLTTGEKKKIWGNPYIRKERIKGEGEVVSMMTKARGTLEININVDRNKAKEIKRLIENAGVSSFYLGKKGLAYVTDIDTRELKHQ